MNKGKEKLHWVLCSGLVLLLGGCAFFSSGSATEDAKRRGSSLGRLACTVAGGELKPAEIAQTKATVSAVQSVLATEPDVTAIQQALAPLPDKVQFYVSQGVAEVAEELGATGVIKKDSAAYVFLENMLITCQKTLAGAPG